jgi:hypothetical protein
MGISYDPPSKKWNISYEKTDKPTDLKADYPIADTVTFYAVPSYTTGRIGKEGYGDTPTWTFSTSNSRPVTPPVTRDRYGGTSTAPSWANRTTKKISLPITASSSDIKNAIQQQTGVSYTAGAAWSRDNGVNFGQNLINETQASNKDAAETNRYNADLNETNLKINTENQARNAAYDKTYQVATAAKGGDYVTQREAIRNLEGIDDTLKSTLENNFKASYLTEKLQAWDGSKLGAKPAYGDFDPSYYVKQNPTLKAQWEAYKANDDVDVVNRYGENGYY